MKYTKHLGILALASLLFTACTQTSPYVGNTTTGNAFVTNGNIDPYASDYSSYYSPVGSTPTSWPQVFTNVVNPITNPLDTPPANGVQASGLNATPLIGTFPNPNCISPLSGTAFSGVSPFGGSGVGTSGCFVGGNPPNQAQALQQALQYMAIGDSALQMVLNLALQVTPNQQNLQALENALVRLVNNETNQWYQQGPIYTQDLTNAQKNGAWQQQILLNLH